MDIKGKVIWITGASSGIGEATAYQMAKIGSKLILSSNEPKELNEVKEKCINYGSACYAIPFDLTQSDEIPRIAQEAIDKYGKIDILFNNGGISTRAFVIDTPIDIDRKIMEINYFSGVRLTKCVLPVMKNSGEGHIVITTSIAGKFGFPLRSAYCASKHALYGFYETLRAEMAKSNIKVTFICPGRVQTKISLRALDKNGKPHAKLDEGQKEGIHVDLAAKKVIKAIKNNKRDVLIGGKELLMVHIKRFMPWLFAKIINKIKPT